MIVSFTAIQWIRMYGQSREFREVKNWVNKGRPTWDQVLTPPFRYIIFRKMTIPLSLYKMTSLPKSLFDKWNNIGEIFNIILYKYFKTVINYWYYCYDNNLLFYFLKIKLFAGLVTSYNGKLCVLSIKYPHKIKIYIYKYLHKLQIKHLCFCLSMI